MKKILIITSHFPPSNLVGVHRARLLSMHLSSLGWEPIVLTVDEQYYEEKLDWKLLELVPDDLRIEKAKAMRIAKPRVIGDIGLRAFRSVYKKAKAIIRQEEIAFLYITIPSFYAALWGRWLHRTTGIAYGIDFRDPWVHKFPGEERILSRAWWATQMAKILEPIAIKKALLITGASESYYEGVVKRNPKLKSQAVFVGLPIGIEPSDFDKVRDLNIQPYLFEKKQNKIRLVYAGAMLPKAYPVLERIFKAIASDRELFQDVELHFIGTGGMDENQEVNKIQPLAKKYDLWQKQVFEHPQWIPYMDVLVHLSAANGVFILGSTESHYTPSKIYQAVLAKKPVFAVLHSDSLAVKVVRKLKSGVVLDFHGKENLDSIDDRFHDSFAAFRSFMKEYHSERVDWSFFEKFTAKEITRKLVTRLDLLVGKSANNIPSADMETNEVAVSYDTDEQLAELRLEPRHLPDEEVQWNGQQKNLHPGKVPNKKILIISPHFPPSNLTAVHRARLFANHLNDFGWTPIILTVDERYYEEEPDWNLHRLLPADLRVEKVRAMHVTHPRVIGDIGLRAFVSVYSKARQLIREEHIDFVYITIPSFYGALWGRRLHRSTGVSYGIDYIDPWVHDFPGSEKLLSRAWLATKIAHVLEPIAVKKAALITGVAEQYYLGVIQRNPHLATHCLFEAMPFGGEQSDHDRVAKMDMKPYLFHQEKGKIQLVYAGAMLPKAYAVLEEIFSSVNTHKALFDHVVFHFIGTGKSPSDSNGFNIRPIAEKYGLWEQQVFEYPKRIPYLDVLVHLNAADGVFLLGSTEPHYTPSKVYQAVMANKPVFAVLHGASTAVEIIRKSHTGLVLSFDNADQLHEVGDNFPELFGEYLTMLEKYDASAVNWSYFNEFSAKAVTQKLAERLDEVMANVVEN